MVLTTSLRRRRPTLGYVLGSPARALAFGFGIGLWSRGPGTLASLVAWPLYVLLSRHLSTGVLIGALGLATLAGVWACQRTGRDLGVEDHGGMVWDEIVAMCWILTFVPATLLAQAIAFGLFRLFDITKPGPVGYVERRVRGGLGVMLDDLVAAFLVLVCFTLWTLVMGA